MSTLKEIEEKLDQLSLEEAFADLDLLLSEMESADASLEDTFARFELGMKLVAVCNERIDRVEKKLLLLQSDGSVTEA